MKNFNPINLIIGILLTILLTTTIIYFTNWLNYPLSNYFSEAINDFYSKVYLTLIIFTLYIKNKYTYFFCLTLLPLHIIYKISGIQYCCTTPFEYTFEIYSFIKKVSNPNTFSDKIANIIYGVPLYGNIVIFIILLLPRVRNRHFKGKQNTTSNGQQV